MRTIVRALMLALSLLSFHEAVYSQQIQVAKSIPNSTSPDGVIGFLEFRPSDYGSQKHPLIIFLHGVGERGNGSASQVGYVAYNSLPNTLQTGRASMRFSVNGQTSSFVVLSPQLSTAYDYWPPFYVKEMIKYAIANLSIDPNRIYVTGLSLGGGGVWRLATDNADYSFDGTIAAAAPVCATQEEYDGNFCATIGANHLPIWAFHCMDDTRVPVGATQHAQALSISCGVSPASKFTYYLSGDHPGAWINAYDTGHITTPVVVNGVTSNFTANPNLFEWFLSNARGNSVAPPPSYTAPVANAGAAQVITLPVATANLSGSGTGTNGATISSYSWSQTAGPSTAVISSRNAAATAVTGLIQGNYVFVLTVTDNHGLTNSAGVAVTVNASTVVNTAPIANAGAVQNTTLPANTVTLSGSGTGTSGATISSYSWSQTTGPSTATINSAKTAVTGVSGLIQGNYVFVLTVTDNHGLTNSAGVAVTVFASTVVNTAPVADPGGVQNITLPVNSVTLSGSGTGTNGATISSYSWSQTAGPSTAGVSAPNSAATSVTGLQQGYYVFVLTVTDNHGLTNSKGVGVTVNAATTTVPVANPGAVQTITLPTSSVTLSGSGTGSSGATISSYSWSQTAGPSSASVTSPNAAATSVTGLQQGYYVFVLTVTDSRGLTDSRGVGVTVNPGTNPLPVANPGNVQTITLPTSSVTLSGSGTGSSGATISSYSWSQTAGPSTAGVGSPKAAATSVTGLQQGYYVFVLTVTDSRGLTDSRGVGINVNPATTTVPVANPGNVQTIALPASSATLAGSATPSSGATISSYSWSQTAGPSTAGISSPKAAVTSVTGLQQGYYVFVLTVTDSRGLTDSKGVAVVVNAVAAAAFNQPIGYIRISTDPSAACSDANPTGRSAVYGTSISNGSNLYTDPALTQIYNGGYNWFSFTPVLGGAVTQSFAIYPSGSIMLLTQCGGTGARTAAASVTNEQAIAMLKAIKDSALSAIAVKETRLTLYPNPVHTNATIEMYSTDNSVKTINVYYSNGVLKAAYKWQTIKGNNIFQLKNITGLANGLYIIDIRDSNGKPNGKMKFIKM